MAKQPPRRTRIVSVASRKPAKPGRPRSLSSNKAKPARTASAKVGTRRGGTRPSSRVPALGRSAATTPAVRPPAAAEEPNSHEVAVELFERGFRALQQREFGRAAELLSSVLNDYHDEKELQERARVYLSICERQAAPRDATPRTFQERVYAATVSINRGSFDEGLALLRKLETEDVSNDHVQYMLAVVHALRGDLEQARRHVVQAMQLNPENCYLASQDMDLEPLRQEPDFVALIESSALRRKIPPAGRRR